MSRHVLPQHGHLVIEELRKRGYGILEESARKVNHMYCPCISDERGMAMRQLEIRLILEEVKGGGE